MALPIETIRLPAVALKDIKQKHPDTWNIVNVGFGKENENQIVEDEAVDACCAVKYPAGSINPGAKGRPTGGLGFYACPMPIFPATDVEMSYKLQFECVIRPCMRVSSPARLPVARSVHVLDVCLGFVCRYCDLPYAVQTYAWQHDAHFPCRVASYQACSFRKQAQKIPALAAVAACQTCTAAPG